jgi:hypothetical protein
MSDATVATTTEPRRPRRGLLFPAVLILLGVVFLLGNLGYIPPVQLRAIVQLWPLILVVWGIEMVIGRREPILALALELGIIVLAIALVAIQPAGLFAPTLAGPSEAIVQREGATTLSLRVVGGAGDYRVSGGAAALVEARSERGQIRARTTRRGDSAEVRVDPAEVTDLFRFNGPPQGVSVQIANDVPASIRIEGGAGDFTLDMRDLTVTDARIETGASNVHLMLPTPHGDIPVRIQAGAASIDIELPAGVEMRLTTRGGALSVQSSNPRLPVVGGAGETSGYAAAKDRVTVTFEGGAATVTVR